MITYQINYTNVKDEPVTAFFNSEEKLMEAKIKFINENKDVEMIDSCIDLGRQLSTNEIKARENEFHHMRDIKDWLNIYFNEKQGK